jgi:cold shock CspA family protein
MRGVITTVKVKRTAEVKGGFGFIRDEHGQDRFFHARDLVTDGNVAEEFNALEGRLRSGEVLKVEFEPVAVTPPASSTNGSNGLRAARVELL